MIELLILKGANLNAKGIIFLNRKILFLIKTIEYKERIFNKKNKTMLHYAAMGNSTEIGEFLISKGADISAKDSLYLNIIILLSNKVI